MPYSQWYIVLGLVVLKLPLMLQLGLVQLVLWLVLGIALNKYRCAPETQCLPFTSYAIAH